MKNVVNFSIKKVDYLTIKGVKTKVEEAEVFQCKGKSNMLNVIVSKSGEVHMSKCANNTFVSDVMFILEDSGVLEASLENQHGGKENLLKFLSNKK